MDMPRARPKDDNRGRRENAGGEMEINSKG
jgi:hypothetical protein